MRGNVYFFFCELSVLILYLFSYWVLGLLSISRSSLGIQAFLCSEQQILSLSFDLVCYFCYKDIFYVCSWICQIFSFRVSEFWITERPSPFSIYKGTHRVFPCTSIAFGVFYIYLAASGLSCGTHSLHFIMQGLSLQCMGSLQLWRASLVVAGCGLQDSGFSSCGTRAQLLRGMWDIRSWIRIEPASLHCKVFGKTNTIM